MLKMVNRIAIPAAIFAVFASVTIVSWIFVRNSVEKLAFTSFEEQIHGDVHHIQAVINLYINTLYSTQIFYETHPSAGQKDFSDYFGRLIHPDMYPGFLSMNFIEKSEKNNSEHYQIKYSEPIVDSVSLGKDLFELSDRKGIIEKARDTDQIAATSKVMFLVSGKNEPGAELFIPIYETGSTHETVEQRRKSIIGVIDAALLAGELFKNIFTKNQNIALEVFDGSKIDEKELYYDSDGDSRPFGEYKPRFAVEKLIKVADRVWTLRFYTLDGYKILFFSEYAPIFTLFVGLLLSFLASYIVYTLSIAKNKAVILADNITKKLKLANETLIMKANDLQVEKNTLAELNSKDEAILSSIGDGLAITDEAGKLVYLNKKASEIIGLGTGGELPESWQEKFGVFDPITLEPFPVDKIPMVRALKGESVNNMVMFIRNPQVPIGKFIRGTATPILLNKKIIGSVAIFTDITKEKEIEKIRMDFLTLASHQLRTPLSGTKWLIETVQRGIVGKLNLKQKEYLNNIYQINERMIRLVSDMLNVLILESGIALPKKEKIRTSELFDELLLVMSAAAQNKKVVLVNGNKKRRSFIIYSDQQSVRNILESFLSNAINYSKNGATVILDVKEEAESVIFSVKDSGIGIPEDEQKGIFERFYRASNAKSFKPDGTGLGLYIAQLLAQKIGGSISFESEYGKGTTFYLRLNKGNV